MQNETECRGQGDLFAGLPVEETAIVRAAGDGLKTLLSRIDKLNRRKGIYYVDQDQRTKRIDGRDYRA